MVPGLGGGPRNPGQPFGQSQLGSEFVLYQVLLIWTINPCSPVMDSAGEELLAWKGSREGSGKEGPAELGRRRGSVEGVSLCVSPGLCGLCSSDP